VAQQQDLKKGLLKGILAKKEVKVLILEPGRGKGTLALRSLYEPPRNWYGRRYY